MQKQKVIRVNDELHKKLKIISAKKGKKIADIIKILLEKADNNEFI